MMPLLANIQQIVMTEGLNLLWLTSEILTLAQPAVAKGISASLVGLASKYTQDPRYGTLTPKDKWAKIYSKTREYAVTLEIVTGEKDI